VEIDQQALATLDASRAAFLDIEIGGDVSAPEAEEARELDIDAEAPRSAADAYQPEARVVELDGEDENGALAAVAVIVPPAVARQIEEAA
jgi:hypothetical protein